MKNGALPVAGDYRGLLLRDAPLLDVRAPVEFAQGAFPTAVNLPLLDDKQRHQIGLRYKEAGQQAAIELGERLVSGALREARIEAWRRFAEAHPEGALYCFRGGLRSRVSQQWLAEAGVVYPRVDGGYKSLRRFLLTELERAAATLELIVIGGRTGTAKTRLIRSLDQGIDLEGLARHRGSAFGRELDPQPRPIDFENALAVQLLKLRARGADCAVLEDEGANIGSLAVPQALYYASQNAPLVVVEAPLAQRVEEILDGYVREMSTTFARRHGEQGPARFEAYLLGALERIRKRLGGARHRELDGLMRRVL
ncbi:MAG: tRNA 2-selenouridine(34) synthase MnmH, partial [Candidatus Competibacterales bacterium]|nr:tRNA 2-selenouridine(34) synthase MnmH [Candidatus Competibacterales bacterium]